MDKEVKIKLNEHVEKIICENLSQKDIEDTVKFDSCKDCWYYSSPWISGDKLHCCAYDFDNVHTSREVKELYDDCPINHETKITKSFIKKYGIIHHKPKEWYDKGSIAVVDFSGTRFEWDGNNPDVDWENVVIFFYETQEEADIMMELALDYYNMFNLDGEYVEKHCYG